MPKLLKDIMEDGELKFIILDCRNSSRERIAEALEVLLDRAYQRGQDNMQEAMNDQ